jgi:hypothetical protein
MNLQIQFRPPRKSGDRLSSPFIDSTERHSKEGSTRVESSGTRRGGTDRRHTELTRQRTGSFSRRHERVQPEERDIALACIILGRYERKSCTHNSVKFVVLPPEVPGGDLNCERSSAGLRISNVCAEGVAP